MRTSSPRDQAASSLPQASLAPAPQVAWLARFSGERFWFLPGSMAGAVLLTAAVMAVTPPSARVAISSNGVVLSLLFAALCSYVMSQRAAPGREQWGWRFIALAEAGYVFAEILLIGLSATRPGSPQLGPAVVLLLPCYGLFALAAVLLPAVQTTGVRLVMVLLDVCIVVSALLGLALVALFAPRLAGTSDANALFPLIPVLDLIALLVLLVLLVGGVQPTYRPAFFWLVVGVGCFAYADGALVTLTWPKLTGYTPGLPLVDPFWIAGAFALALAPLSRLTPGGDTDPAWAWLERLAGHLSRPRRAGLAVQVCMLITPVLVLLGLLALATLKPEPGAALPLELLTLAVVLLILVRQVLTMRDLVEARVATARAERLDALKDQFITSVNHELRTPVMTVQSNMALLRALHERQDVDPARRFLMLDRAERATGALVQLIEAISDVRRIEQEDASLAEREAVNVSESVQMALSLVDLRQGHAAEYVVDLRIPEGLTIWGEPVRLQQIFTNLISNAVKYSPPGTTVIVAALSDEDPAAPVRRVITPGDHPPFAEITVQDEGPGIPPEQIPLLFRRFVRLERDIASPVRGTGLGLYLCRRFAEAMDGSIWVESTGVPGEGAIFHLRLPAQPPIAQRFPAIRPPAISGGSRPAGEGARGVPARGVECGSESPRPESENMPAKEDTR